VPGIVLAGLDLWASSFGLSPLGTLRHGKPDHATLRPGSTMRPREVFRADGVTTFDRLTSVFVSGTRHEEDQPVHLRVHDLALQKASEHDVYAGPSTRYCPAAVYEWVEHGDGLRYQINAANCVHCKTCDIKDPNQNIDWVPPEGGDGPNYRSM
jgi:electron-transferring-flavoprotein dehydrogenase